MRILRHEVPVDSRFHPIVCGPVLHVRAYVSSVEFWALDNPARRSR